MTQENKELPLYKRLNQQRTPGEWGYIDGWDEKGEGHFFPSLVMKKPNRGKWHNKEPRVVFNASHDQQIISIMANVKYTALAVNNLAEIAEALDYLIFCADPATYSGGENLAEALTKAKEALNRIS